jgi:cytochrome P450
MLHDETHFPQPENFKPDRYLNETGTLRTLRREEDPTEIAFGFGRVSIVHIENVMLFIRA